MTEQWERRYREALDAAATAFADGGYLGVTTAHIASRLGIRQGSLYYYFASKEAALSTICELGVTRVMDGLCAIVSTPLPAAAKLTAAIANHLQPLRSRPGADYVRVFVRHRHELPDSARQRVSALAHAYRALLEDLFREGIANGEFQPSLDPKLATLALLGLCNSVVAGRTLPRGPLIDDIIEEYARIFIEGVEAQHHGTPLRISA